MSRIDTYRPGYPQFTGVMDLETGGQVFSESLARITKYADDIYINDSHFIYNGTAIGRVAALDGDGLFIYTEVDSDKDIYIVPDGLKLCVYGSLSLQEYSSAPADVVGLGQFWVKSDTPNIPMFTSDAGGAGKQLATLPVAEATYAITSGATTYATSAGYAATGPFLPLTGGTLSGHIELGADNTYWCGNFFANSWTSVCSYNFVDISPSLPPDIDLDSTFKAIKLKSAGGYDKDTLPRHVVLENPTKNMTKAEKIAFAEENGVMVESLHGKDGTNIGGLLQLAVMQIKALTIRIEELESKEK